jgi:hypothetical protein
MDRVYSMKKNLSVQSNLIRSFLLFCPINYEHIQSRYKCFTTRQLLPDSNDKQWKHLEQIDIHQLENQRNFLQ